MYVEWEVGLTMTTGNLLDFAVATFDEKNDEDVQRMQTVSGSCNGHPSTR